MYQGENGQLTLLNDKSIAVVRGTKVKSNLYKMNVRLYDKEMKKNTREEMLTAKEVSPMWEA